ncbi:MAG TPA: glycerate kinase [Acidimicrobiia bacterium]
MRILVAPDKFKGTLTAAQAAEAISRGWVRADSSAEVDAAPMADGGEGTLDALVAALGGERHRVRVSGPLGDPVDAQFAVVSTPDGPTAVVEMARASGLDLIAPARRDPKRATTRGTGELILAACRGGVRRVLVCIGGSATNDAGAGLAQALGVRLLDEGGRDLGPGGAALATLARIDLTGLDPAAAGSTFVVATDVDNPLVGPQGASAVYGPQKGASPEDVGLLDRALGHFAAVVYRDLGVDVRTARGAGAAGGLGAGLIAFLGARLRPGVDVVMEALRLPERMETADIAVTGEGTFDEQSLHGKAPAGVLRVAEEAGVPAVILCGQGTVDPGKARIFALADRFGLEAALGRTGPLLEDLAAEAAGELARERSGGRSR